MSSSADLPRTAGSYDGQSEEALAERWKVPKVYSFETIGSTLDAAHKLAEHAPSGTVILAGEQTAGRGRHGRRWTSAPDAGVWLTIIERPTDARALDVLALRCGLYAAEALDRLAGAAISVKWPNDLHVNDRKLAGILIETRWRGTAPEWVAIGFGLNVIAPSDHVATGLIEGTTRVSALDHLIPALRRAASASRHLSDEELLRWRTRDRAVGRLITEPVAGTVQGISSAGELLVLSEGGVSAHRSGSLTFAEPLTCS